MDITILIQLQYGHHFREILGNFLSSGRKKPSAIELQFPAGVFGVLASIVRRIYSYLNASTGFFVAALQLCQLTVTKAMPRDNNPASAKIHQLSSVRYAKF